MELCVAESFADNGNYLKSGEARGKIRVGYRTKGEKL